MMRCAICGHRDRVRIAVGGEVGADRRRGLFVPVAGRSSDTRGVAPVRSSVVFGMLVALGDSDCEFLRDGLLAQPVNAVTSLSFVVVGVWIAGAARRRDAPRATSLVFAALLVAVGAGSVVFHGPQPSGASLMHDVPILATATFVVVVTISRLVQRTTVRHSALVVLLGVVAAAAAAWTLGRTGGALCDPDSVVQLHGVWHLLSALALVLWWTLALGSSPGVGSGTYAGGEQRGYER